MDLTRRCRLAAGSLVILGLATAATWAARPADPVTERLLAIERDLGTPIIVPADGPLPHLEGTSQERLLDWAAQLGGDLENLDGVLVVSRQFVRAQPTLNQWNQLVEELSDEQLEVLGRGGCLLADDLPEWFAAEVRREAAANSYTVMRPPDTSDPSLTHLLQPRLGRPPTPAEIEAARARIELMKRRSEAAMRLERQPAFMVRAQLQIHTGQGRLPVFMPPLLAEPRQGWASEGAGIAPIDVPMNSTSRLYERRLDQFLEDEALALDLEPKQ